MNAKGITYATSERFDILTLMTKHNKKVFAQKKIAKDKPTPEYQGVLVFRNPS